MITYFILFNLVVSTFSFEDLEVSPYPIRRNITDEYILCRSCGGDVASTSHLFSKSSPASIDSFKDTLFNEDEVLVQVLSNNIFFHFPVITSVQSTCISIGEWEDVDSWFPGYRWKPCVCPDCGAFIGWVFEPLDSTSNRFFGLIITSLVGETFIDSLTKYPEQLI